MTIKQWAFGLLACLALSANAQTNQALLTPQSGNLNHLQKFDINVALSGAVLPIGFPIDMLKNMLQVTATIDGKDQTAWFKACYTPLVSRTDGSLSLFCPGQSSNLFGAVGAHTFDVSVIMPWGENKVYQAHADYQLFSALKAVQLPYKMNVLTNNSAMATGIFVAPGDNITVSASGYADVWPAPGGFPIHDPRGYVNCGSGCILPNSPVGALLFKVGATGAWTAYRGGNQPVTIPQAGELMFAVNDKAPPEYWTDNIGSYDVIINGYIFPPK